MFLSPIQILEHLPVRAGDKVGDFGAGQGIHTRALAHRLGNEGALYAFDIHDAHVEALHKARVRESIDNLFSLCADLNSHVPLKDAILHCSLLSNTLHALSNRSHFLSELYRVTKPKGRVLMVDWASSFNGVGPTDETVITPGEAVQLFKAHGFSVGDMLPAGTHHYAFIATKA